tara:strand:+ start:512 stop:637 length:126 start_codon:yes stop_codon:yes gene_type:complete
MSDDHKIKPEEKPLFAISLAVIFLGVFCLGLLGLLVNIFGS